MKKTMIIAAAIGLIAVAGIGNAWAGRISDRQMRQENRIYQGIRSGELTRHETHLLMREQFRIERFRSRAWSDGRFTPRERRMLERRLNRASRHIYELKHNDNFWR